MVAQALKESVRTCQLLQEYLSDCLDRLSQRVELVGMNGSMGNVVVHPARGHVVDLKRAVKNLLNLPLHSQGLSTISDNTPMRNERSLLDYDLSKGAMLVKLAQRMEGQVVQLLFEDPENLAFDSVSASAGSFLHPEGCCAMSKHGREGITLSGYCTLRLPVRISLGHAWTISLWTLEPTDHHMWRNLVDGDGDDNIVVTLREGFIGYYNQNAYIDFNFYSLETQGERWHHFAAVGVDGRTTYYVDGAAVGSINGQARAHVRAVGNRGDGLMEEAWGTMSDFRIYSTAATKEEIQYLAQNT
eukprot:NODE_11798_length_1264_cov_7.671064.p1 GENE.NODE_11798_length_1264_cov_7.671064~~NODE_11798_length_1264_cov_7.671064.p1  ORF type:complete len:338 (-),score=78.70 NODE_11798_length_1264_cov_7.671064:251-1153(-)